MWNDEDRLLQWEWIIWAIAICWSVLWAVVAWMTDLVLSDSLFWEALSVYGALFVVSEIFRSARKKVQRRKLVQEAMEAMEMLSLVMGRRREGEDGK